MEALATAHSVFLSELSQDSTLSIITMTDSSNNKKNQCIVSKINTNTNTNTNANTNNNINKEELAVATTTNGNNNKFVLLKHNSIIIMVVQTGERNFSDQRHLHFQLQVSLCCQYDFINNLNHLINIIYVLLLVYYYYFCLYS